MRNSTKAGMFVAFMSMGLGVLSLAFAPVKAPTVIEQAPTVIQLPEVVITATPSRLMLDEVTITAPVKRPSKAHRSAPTGRQTSYHSLAQGGSPDHPLVLVTDNGPTLDQVMSRKF